MESFVKPNSICSCSSKQKSKSSFLGTTKPLWRFFFTWAWQTWISGALQEKDNGGNFEMLLLGNLIRYLLLSYLILLLRFHRCILEILWPLMAVLLFSAETSFHMLKNTRYEHFWVRSYWLVCTYLIHLILALACVGWVQ